MGLTHDPAQRPIGAGSRHLGWLGLITAALTLSTFAVAYTTPPRSGPLCTVDCIPAPYTEAARFVPRDYIWLYPAIVVTVLVVVLVAALTRQSVSPGRALLGRSSLAIAGIGAGVLVLDYGIQLTVLQPLLLRGEAGGVGFLTQYHPHGLFIGLEDIGYTAIAIAFVVAGSAMTPNRRAYAAIRWVLWVGGAVVIGALVVMATIYGSDLAYRFELVAISVSWLVVVLVGSTLALEHLRATGAAASSRSERQEQPTQAGRAC